MPLYFMFLLLPFPFFKRVTNSILPCLKRVCGNLGNKINICLACFQREKNGERENLGLWHKQGSLKNMKEQKFNQTTK